MFLSDLRPLAPESDLAHSADPADEPTAFHALPVEAALAWLEVDPAVGLSATAAAERLMRYGPNRLRPPKTTSTLTIFLRQLRSPVVWLLLGAAAVSAGLSDWLEAAAIGVVLAVNTGVGFATELRAVRSMEALRGLGARTARLLRDGRVSEAPADALTPGDIVLLEAGDAVPADLRLLRAANLAADESMLTGEAVPVDKQTAPVAADAPIGDRTSMLFKGASITRGSAAAVVVGTGLQTELGRISALVEQVEDEQTPLERRLEQLTNRLIWATIGLAALVIAVGAASGRDLALMAEAGIALAVAAIPEGLPIVATLILARGMLRMARRNALVERLSAVETLGAATVILTDKTGTLTENRMTVERVLTPAGAYDLAAGAGVTRAGAPITLADAPDLEEALLAGALCTNATLAPDSDEATGDPTETALLLAARRAGLDVHAVARLHDRLAEEAFDSTAKRMATTHRRPAGDAVILVKGAPEAVLPLAVARRGPDGDAPLSEDARADWLRQAEAAAAEGRRTLALATRTIADGAPEGDVYRDLVFLGLAILHDPPRPDVRPAIEACRRAGIDVVMATGDHIATARSIAEAVGLAPPGAPALGGRQIGAAGTDDPARAAALAATPVFARVSPEQKLDLIRLHQDRGQIVAMTGDGVNDAPALRQADIGIAMGRRGTQVARDAADIVLTDDAFPTIVTAIREGRVIFGNIRRFALYLLSCNLSEIMIVGGAVLAGLPLPLTPLQILFLNLVTDVFPAFALGLGEGDEDVLARRPRDPKEGVLARRHWLLILAYGALITAATLAAMQLSGHMLGLAHEETTTVAFLTLALAQLWHVFNMRDLRRPVWRSGVVRNRYVWLAIGFCLLLLAAALYLPILALPLGAAPLALPALTLALGASLAPVLTVECATAIARRFGKA